jgi:hypothetical protein
VCRGVLVKTRAAEFGTRRGTAAAFEFSVTVPLDTQTLRCLVVRCVVLDLIEYSTLLLGAVVLGLCVSTSTRYVITSARSGEVRRISAETSVWGEVSFTVPTHPSVGLLADLARISS